MSDDSDLRTRPGTGSATPVAATSPLPRVIDSRRLFEGTREVLIRHAGSEYRLRLTQFNKLILTK